MAIGGYLNINILYTKQYETKEVIHSITDTLGEPTSILIYYPEIDETIEYSNLEQIFYSEKRIRSPLTFNYVKSNLNTSLIYTYVFNNSYQANIISIPMEHIERENPKTIEILIFKNLKRIYKTLPFVFAYCLHEHEIDIDEISGDFADEILDLRPSLYFQSKENVLEMKHGETLLDGMTER